MHCGVINRFSFYQPAIHHVRGLSMILLLLQRFAGQDEGRVDGSHLQTYCVDTHEGGQRSDTAFDTWPFLVQPRLRSPCFPNGSWWPLLAPSPRSTYQIEDLEAQAPART